MDFLERRTWRDLRAVARAHGLRFNNNLTREAALSFLQSTLFEQHYIQKALSHLSEHEREALMALKAADGRLPRWRFSQVYGQIRPYRPWQEDAPVNPWRHPISIAEKLWFLGFIEVDEHRFVCLPSAVAALLPPLPQPQIVVWEASGEALTGNAVVRDMAVLLGVLLSRPVRLLHGRWLPPYTLHRINQRLSRPENLDGIRSEFQCQYIRFLHYAAQVAGLIHNNEGFLAPTPLAWDWLSRSYADAHGHLMTSIRADLRRSQPVWEQFRLPPVGAATWDFLVGLPVGRYTVGSLGDVLRLHALQVDSSTRIRAALLGPLRWLGRGTVEGAIAQMCDPAFAPCAPAVLHAGAEAIGITLPASPACRSLAELMAYITVNENGLWLDQSAVSRAVEQGQTSDSIAQTLVALIYHPLPEALLTRLRTWERAARRVHLQPVVVLEAVDASAMRAIRADWRLRPLLGAQLSPRHVVVHDEQGLRQRLARRGYPIAQTSTTSHASHTLTNTADPAYLWLALRICQGIAGLIPAPVTFPGAAAKALEPMLHGRGDFQYLADQYVGQIKAALKGKTEGRSLVTQPDPHQIRSRIETALAVQGAVRIRYYSPAAGEETERTIEPELLYDRNGATYIEAWCNLDNASRTFRLDRVLAVL